MRYKVNYWYLKFIFNIVGIYLINCRAVDPAIILTTTCRQPAEQEPPQTISAPCQNENDSGALSSTAASAEESTGVKYEPTAIMVTLPCSIPTFHAA